MTERDDCPLRHANGNCLPVGGFCTSVNDEICKGLKQAYECGKQDGVLLACVLKVVTE